MNSAMLQRQLKLNTWVLTDLYDSYNGQRRNRKEYLQGALVFPQLADLYRGQANIYTPCIRKTRKRIAALEQLQKSLKVALKEAYWQENFAKTYEPLPDDEDDFLWLTQAEIVTKEGIPVPTWQGGCAVDD